MWSDRDLAPAGSAPGGSPFYPGGVSTRMLIILALVCGLALLVAAAIQAAQIL